MVILPKTKQQQKNTRGGRNPRRKGLSPFATIFSGGPNSLLVSGRVTGLDFPKKNTCFAKLYPVQSRFIHVPGYGKSKFDTYVLKRASNLRSYEEESLKLEGKHRTSVRPPWIKTWVNRNESTRSRFCLSSHTSSIQGATHTSNMCSFRPVKGGI